MATLGQLYSHNKGDFDMTTKKSYFVGVSYLYIEDGYNIRDIDWTHVQDFKKAYIEGDYVPALVVDVTEKGIKVIDGHHRFLAIQEAIKDGYEITRVKCEDFVGNESDKIALMITSSQGRVLSPAERAAAYYRLSKYGLTYEEIAKKVKRSISDVREHLKLAECDQQIIQMVKNKELNYKDAIKIQKENGTKASDVAKNLLNEAKENGKSKVVSQKFNYKTAYTKLSKEVQSVINDLDNADIENSAEVITKALTDLNNILTAINLSNNIDN